MNNLKSTFTKLLFIASVSIALGACSSVPSNNNNTGGGTTTGGGTQTGGGTTTGGGTQTGGGTTTGTTNTTNPDHLGFVVQLTASVNEAKASQLTDTFSAEGYHVIQNSIERGGRTLYRVQVGPYALKQDAKSVLIKMKNRYKRNAYVRSAFVNENK